MSQLSMIFDGIKEKMQKGACNGCCWETVIVKDIKDAINAAFCAGFERGSVSRDLGNESTSPKSMDLLI